MNTKTWSVVADKLVSALVDQLEVSSCRVKSFVGGAGAVLPPVFGCGCCVCEAARTSHRAIKAYREM